MPKKLKKVGQSWAKTKKINGLTFTEYLASRTKRTAEADKKVMQKRGYQVRIRQRVTTAVRFPDNKRIKIKEFVTWVRKK